jgi:hypothetical protein
LGEHYTAHATKYGARGHFMRVLAAAALAQIWKETPAASYNRI